MSAARLAKLAPGELDPAQHTLYQAITGGPRAAGPQHFRLRDDEGALEGPFNAFLLQPRLGTALQSLGSAVRYQTDLSARSRETAILVVADRWNSAFEWYAHAAVALSVGLSETELAAVRDGRYADLPDAERIVAEATARLVDAFDLDDDAYAEALAALGPAGLFELLTLVGYYATLALQLRVYRVGPPAD